MAQTQYDSGTNYGGYSGYDNNYGYGEQQQNPGTSGAIIIKGLEGLQGFGPGQNRLSLAVQPVSQQDNMLYFQVIGFAITDMGCGQAAIYSLKAPFAGVIDPSRNTMQIDISNIDSAVDQSAYVDGSMVYNIMRNSPQVTIIDMDMTYQGTQDTQTVFSVSGVDIVPPDGNMKAFSPQQPMQLIIDAGNFRITATTFPEMVEAFGSSCGMAYPGVQPVASTEPVPVQAPAYEPYMEPIPAYYGGYVPYNPFYFPYGFRPFPHVFPHPTGLITPTPRFPTPHPTMHPPTQHPTLHPTMHPPTQHPTLHPTMHPPTQHPTMHPTMHPPTSHPTGLRPTGHPTGFHPTGHPAGLTQGYQNLQRPISPQSGIISPGNVRTPSRTSFGGMSGGGIRGRR